MNIWIEDSKGLNKLIAAMLAIAEQDQAESASAAYQRIWEEIKYL